MVDNNFKNNRGFTLAEMLVTVGVFAITISVSSVVFLNVNNLQQQAANMAKLQNEGRYMLEKIGKEIRGRELDYNGTYHNVPNLPETLAFKKDEFGDSYKIFFDQPAGLAKIENNQGTAEINSSGVTVAAMKFIVTPSTDPYVAFSNGSLSPALPQLQPRVTILLTLKNKDVPERFQKTLTMQTTISSKTYR